MNNHNSIPGALEDAGHREIGRIPKGPSILYFILRSKALTDPYRILTVFREVVDRWGGVPRVLASMNAPTS